MADASTGKTLNFVWWNVQDLYHFDADRTKHHRWPSSVAAYDAKCDRVAQVLKECGHALGGVDVIILGEVTDRATRAVRDLAFPGYEYYSFDLVQDAPALQVAFIYRREAGVQIWGPLMPQWVPDSTRPMGAIDVVLQSDRIRIVACHWAARFGELQQRTRQVEAQALAVHAYDFLRADAPASKPHLLAIGDFNEEPFSPTMTDWLWASRRRSRARAAEHHADTAIKRVHLYNAAWRLLGERAPFTGGEDAGIAGTMHWHKERTWHTLDHVIVSGSLLTPEVPYLDETALQLFASPSCLVDGTPTKFSFDKDVGTGVSDHLPLIGKIVLARS